MSDEIDTLFMAAAEACQESGELRRDVSRLLQAADTGVEDIHVEFTAQNLPKAEPGMTEDFQEFLKAANKFVASNPVPRVTAQRRDSIGSVVRFNFREDESQGTQRFFALAAPLLGALATGALVIVDELDASMHPLLTRRLLEMFQSAEANPNGAQLLFTTHDASLLDEDLFRRDQIWLAEKCDGASAFFSLADIRPPVRNTESFLRNYLAGRYGGTPHLGLAFDDLTIGSKA